MCWLKANVSCSVARLSRGRPEASARQAGGVTDEAYVMRNVDDPNDITVVLGWSDLEKARAFSQPASLKEAMQKAGVIGPPEVRFWEAAG
jgi:hypothetical protein